MSRLDTKSLIIGAVLGVVVVPRVIGFVASKSKR